MIHGPDLSMYLVCGHMSIKKNLTAPRAQCGGSDFLSAAPEVLRHTARHTDGFTPIHRACWGDTPMHTVAVKVFLEAGVDPEERPIKDGKQGPLCVEMSNNDATKRMLKTWMEKKKDEL